jgi:hypothetical protein
LDSSEFNRRREIGRKREGKMYEKKKKRKVQNAYIPIEWTPDQREIQAEGCGKNSRIQA